MEKKLPEVTAKEILTSYSGSNNYILAIRNKIYRLNLVLSKTQADYIIKYHSVIPKIAKKYVSLYEPFAKKLQEDKELKFLPEKVWIEKLLCDSEKAYHMWGKFSDDQPLQAFWLPKIAIIPEEKRTSKIIDYSKYDVRPPMEHQKEAVERLLGNNKFILADDQGTGKSTSATIAALESESKKILIVCPTSLKINWKREISIYSDKSIYIIEGKKWESGHDFYIINYDILKNFHTTDKSEDSEAYKLIVSESFDLAIVDEAHYISNATAQRSKLLTDILSKIPKVWLLTGTPMTSRPINYFNLLKIVESPLTLNWQNYVKRYCKGYQFSVKGSTRKVWNVNGASNLDELREKTRNIVLRRLKTDILDLPEKIITPIYLELTNKFYDEELEDFIKITKENKNKESIAIAINRLMKVRQIIAMEKLQHTCELIDNVLEQDKKVIIFTNFTATLDELHNKYKKNSVILDGRMSKEKRQDSVDKFQNDPKIKIFISNIKAGGVGITLTAAETVIMNDLSFVPADHSQAEDRAYRYGQKNSVVIYYPVFENTIEIQIYNMLERKKNVIGQVLGDIDYSEDFVNNLFKDLFSD